MMKKVTKYTFFMLILGLLGCALLYPFWFEWTPSYEKTINNTSARIDISGIGTNSEIIAENDAIDIKYPDWCKKETTKCALLYPLIKKDYTHYGIKIKDVKDKKLEIRLRGPEKKVDNTRQKVLVDYKDFFLDDKLLLSETRTVWHDSPAFYLRENTADNVVILNFFVRQHPFLLSDIYEQYGDFYQIHFDKLIASFLISFVVIWLFFTIVRKYRYEALHKILFLLIIGIFLSWQLLTISKLEISKQENRNLNRFPKIFVDGRINSAFGTKFNDWLNDHIGGRDTLIDLHFKLMYTLNGKIANEVAFIGDGGWMFDTSRIKYVDSEAKQQEKIDEISDILKHLADHIKNKNIPIYVLLLPDRDEFLVEYWKRYYPPQPRLNVKKRLQNALSDYPNVHIFDVDKKLNELIFIKDDIHLNGNGSALLLKETLKYMNIEEPEYDIVYTEQKDHHLSDRLKIPKNEPKTDKLLKINLKNITPAYEKFVFHNMYSETENKNYLIDKSIYLLGVCYTRDSFESFFQSVFKKTYRITFYPFLSDNDNIEYRKQKIAEYVKSADENSVFLLVMPKDSDRSWKIIKEAINEY